MRACTCLAEVGEAAETAVFDAGEFEGAGALWVLFVAGGAPDVGVVGVCVVEGGADGEVCADEGFDY